MRSRSRTGATPPRKYLPVIAQVAIALSAALLSLCAHAQDFCAPGWVPVSFACGYGNASLNVNTTPCYSTSITAIEAGLKAYNYPQLTWSNWYPGTYRGNAAGIPGTYLAIFVDLTGPAGTDY